MKFDLLSKKQHLLLILVCCLTLFSSLPAAAQGDELRTLIEPLNDPGLMAAYEQGLITETHLEQTVDGMTITLRWLMADAMRISVGYTITFPPETKADMMHTDLALVDTAGNIYPPSGGSGGQLGTDQTAIFSQNFDPTEIDDLPEKLNLVLAAKLRVFPEVNHSPENGQTFGPFRFAFEVPYSGGYRLNNVGIIKQQNVEVDLQQVVLAPSGAVIRYCLTLPFQLGGYEYFWNAGFKFFHNGEPVEAISPGGGGGGGGGGSPTETITQCGGEWLYLKTDTLSGKWTLSADEITGYKVGPLPPELEARLQKGESYDSMKPEMIKQGYLKSIRGQWEFTFTLP